MFQIISSPSGGPRYQAVVHVCPYYNLPRRSSHPLEAGPCRLHETQSASTRSFNQDNCVSSCHCACYTGPAAGSPIVINNFNLFHRPHSTKVKHVVGREGEDNAFNGCQVSQAWTWRRSKSRVCLRRRWFRRGCPLPLPDAIIFDSSAIPSLLPSHSFSLLPFDTSASTSNGPILVFLLSYQIIVFHE